MVQRLEDVRLSVVYVGTFVRLLLVVVVGSNVMKDFHDFESIDDLLRGTQKGLVRKTLPYSLTQATKLRESSGWRLWIWYENLSVCCRAHTPHQPTIRFEDTWAAYQEWGPSKKKPFPDLRSLSTFLQDP